MYSWPCTSLNRSFHYRQSTNRFPTRAQIKHRHRLDYPRGNCKLQRELSSGAISAYWLNGSNKRCRGAHNWGEFKESVWEGIQQRKPKSTYFIWVAVKPQQWSPLWPTGSEKCQFHTCKSWLYRINRFTVLPIEDKVRWRIHYEVRAHLQRYYSLKQPNTPLLVGNVVLDTYDIHVAPSIPEPSEGLGIAKAWGINRTRSAAVKSLYISGGEFKGKSEVNITRTSMLSFIRPQLLRVQYGRINWHMSCQSDPTRCWYWTD